MIIIPAGTRIYLTKRKPFMFNILPDTTMLNDHFYVAYDVRIDGVTVIPRGTKILGNWVTESIPTIAAQLQLTHIFLPGLRCGRPICADSAIYQAVTMFNSAEVGNTSYLYRLRDYHQTVDYQVGKANNRRIVRFPCEVVALNDNNLNRVYLEISTREIPVDLIVDFVVG